MPTSFHLQPLLERPRRKPAGETGQGRTLPVGGRGRESSSPTGARGAKTRGLGLVVVAGDGRRSRLASSPPWPRRARAGEGGRTIRDLGRGRGRGQGRGWRGPGSRRPAFAARARPPGLLGGSETAGGEGSGLRTLELGCRIVRHRHGRCTGSWQGWSGRRRRGASRLGMCTVLTKRAAPMGLSKVREGPRLLGVCQETGLWPVGGK